MPKIELKIPQEVIDKNRPVTTEGYEGARLVPILIDLPAAFGLPSLHNRFGRGADEFYYNLHFGKYRLRCARGHEEWAWFLDDEKHEIAECKACKLADEQALKASTGS